MSLKKAQQERGLVKSKLTRFRTYMDKFDPVNGTTELSKRLEKIEPLLDEFEKLTLQIDSNMAESGLEAESDEESALFENSYFSLVAEAQAAIDRANIPLEVVEPTNSNQVAQSQNSYKKLNLPQITLPKFKGDYTEYMNFHSAFSSLVHKNDTLSKFEKFTFLNSCLEDEAAKVIQSLEIREENYDDAWTLIKNRYENKQVIINSHLKKIFELPQLVKENAAGLRNLTDCLRREVKALKNLNQAVDSWDSILLYMITEKLDHASKRQWQSSVKRDSLPTFQEFLNFLDNRCVMLETICPKTEGINQNTNKKYENEKSKRGSYANVANSNEISCRFCKGAHLLYYCKKFLSLIPVKRLAEIKQLKLCTKCLRNNYPNHSCVESNCKVCNKPHNTLLHIDKYKEADKTSETTQQADSQGNERSSDFKPSPSVSAHCTENFNNIVILSTAVIYVHDKNNKLVECRCLLDTGSQNNFMTLELAKRLKLNFKRAHSTIIGINGKSTEACKSGKTMIRSRFNDFSKELNFLILDVITGVVPEHTFSINNLNLPANIELADPTFNQMRNIDILLGVSSFYELLGSEQIRLGKNKPILQNTQLGWIISGSLPIINKERRLCLSSICPQNELGMIRDQIEKFWIVEDIFTSRCKSKIEEYCENHFIENHYRDSNGRFVVSLPLKENVNNLGNTFEIASKRFASLEVKLAGNPKLSDVYSKFMREYEQLGHMTELNSEQIISNDIVYYLPHHAVFKESSATTKVRVVFDGSCKGLTNLSLNDVSYVGPVIQDDLFSILIRFRKHKFVIKADITKMYRQINVNAKQRNLQRILWRENPNQEVKHFTLNTVTYGTAPASFLAVRSLHQIAFEYENKFPLASKTIIEDFYMDDLITGGETVADVRKLKVQITEILNSAGLVLSQWMSNNISILETSEQNKIKNFLISEDGTLKTLGVLWNTSSDAFQYAGDIALDRNLTKRTILSVIAQIFDPLGLIGPIIVRAKIILQQLWQQQLEWDDPVPRELECQFEQFCRDLQAIKQISIPRCIINCLDPGIQLHGFSDSSEMAYGACIYARSRDKVNNRQNVHLICAKSRVAPLKTLSLPRLELCGAVLMTQLMRKVISALKLNIDKVCLWTDSEIVLAWISQDPSKWKTFVSNRVSEIQRSIPYAIWGHVSSKDNPADVISRGCNASQLKDDLLWLSGPTWLEQDQEFWPKQAGIDINEETELQEIKCQKALSAIDSIDASIFDRFSSLNRLLRVVAFCNRFVNNCRTSKEKRNTNDLTLGDINFAEDMLIRLIQAQYFSKELKELRLSNHISRSSKLISLNPFLDKSGILRVGGRLHNSFLDYNQKFPIVLPANHRFVELIIQYEHKRTFHGGVQNVLSNIRTKYWPLRVKPTIKRSLKGCILCYKCKPVTTNPIMGNLPADRVNPVRPFWTTGIDCAGPFLIKDGKTRNKRLVKSYMCLFICFSTKAVHIELVGDMTSEGFLNSLKRFVARRGICKNIITDNGTNFTGANNILNSLLKNVRTYCNDDSIKSFLLQNKIEWKFIPARSPHFGGLWEAAIKSAKSHLMKVIGDAHLTYEQFNTVLTQVESILNSRPLSPLSDDPNDLQALTPGHFLIGAKLNSLPEEDVTDIKYRRLNHFQRIQQVLQHFWKRFSLEYVHNLQQRSKWKYGASALKMGALVLLKEDNLPPLMWKMGRIVEVHPGKDGNVRVASVKTSSGIVKRAFNKLCVLPIDEI